MEAAGLTGARCKAAANRRACLPPSSAASRARSWPCWRSPRCARCAPAGTLDDPQLTATVFAPNNAAIARALRDGGGSQEALLQNRQLLAAILSYHVIPGRAFRADQLKKGLKFSTLQVRGAGDGGAGGAAFAAAGSLTRPPRPLSCRAASLLSTRRAWSRRRSMRVGGWGAQAPGQGFCAALWPAWGAGTCGSLPPLA